VRGVLRLAAEMDLSEPPPVVGQEIHAMLRELTGNADPYRAAKQRFNRMALELLPRLRQRVEQAEDGFELATRLAVAGNVVDLGVNGALGEQEVLAEVDEALESPLRGDLEAFRSAVADARHVLYVADNAGEIVFDRLLVEQLLPRQVTVAVRGAPVINDATREDAAAAGLDQVAEIIDSGSDAPGAVLELCGEPFRAALRKADVVIAKGQGNFEALSDATEEIFFLFKVKCPVIASAVGLATGTLVLLRSPARPAADEPDATLTPGSHENEEFTAP
jgi:hypothetical protein